MSNSYEQQWQQAMAGVSIQPSEGLWNNIVTNLDASRGRNAWVTILLIAATVTIAFAFPLTIGNSSFEARPDAQHYISNLEDTTTNSPEITNSSSQPDINQTGVNQSKTDQISNNQLNITPQGNANKVVLAVENNATAGNNTPLTTSTKETNSTMAQYHRTGNNDEIVLLSAEVQAYGLEYADIGSELAPVNIDDYYFLPFFVPETSQTDSELMASLNMGTGSSSGGSGFKGFGLMESADLATGSNDPVNTITDQRFEQTGTTYYFGAAIELPLGERWSFLAGLGYLTQQAKGTSNLVLDNQGTYQPVATYDPIYPETNYLNSTYPYHVTNSYINVPLTIKYPFINRKIKFRAGFGISTDFMLSHTVGSQEYGNTKYTLKYLQYSPVALAALVNMDISYDLNNTYAVALEAGIRKGITAIDDQQEYYPSSFIIGLILFYKIQ